MIGQLRVRRERAQRPRGATTAPNGRIGAERGIRAKRKVCCSRLARKMARASAGGRGAGSPRPQQPAQAPSGRAGAARGPARPRRHQGFENHDGGRDYRASSAGAARLALRSFFTPPLAATLPLALALPGMLTLFSVWWTCGGAERAAWRGGGAGEAGPRGLGRSWGSEAGVRAGEAPFTRSPRANQARRRRVGTPGPRRVRRCGESAPSSAKIKRGPARDGGTQAPPSARVREKRGAGRSRSPRTGREGPARPASRPGNAPRQTPLPGIRGAQRLTRTFPSKIICSRTGLRGAL